MSEPRSRLPARPSLAQLRKLAKELLRELGTGSARASPTPASPTWRGCPNFARSPWEDHRASRAPAWRSFPRRYG
jgi:hypothetical protein